MVKLRVLEILEKTGESRYSLFNKINTIRSTYTYEDKPLSQMSYTNFVRIINNGNASIKLYDIDILCQALNCEIKDILVKE